MFRGGRRGVARCRAGRGGREFRPMSWCGSPAEAMAAAASGPPPSSHSIKHSRGSQRSRRQKPSILKTEPGGEGKPRSIGRPRGGARLLMGVACCVAALRVLQTVPGSAPVGRNRGRCHISAARRTEVTPARVQLTRGCLLCDAQWSERQACSVRYSRRLSFGHHVFRRRWMTKNQLRLPAVAGQDAAAETPPRRLSTARRPGVILLQEADRFCPDNLLAGTAVRHARSTSGGQHVDDLK